MRRKIDPISLIASITIICSFCFALFITINDPDFHLIDFLAIAFLHLLILYPFIWDVFDIFVPEDEGEEELKHPQIGKQAEVIDNFVKAGDAFEGKVSLNGSQWRSRCKTHQLMQGEQALVTDTDGLTLVLEKQE